MSLILIGCELLPLEEKREIVLIFFEKGKLNQFGLLWRLFNQWLRCEGGS